jgi:hypothetical protein
MSILSANVRPWVTFDPKNKDHRKWVYDFVKTGAWGSCPVRFLLPDGLNNLNAMVQHQMLEYYMDKEFHRVAEKA